MRDPRLLRSVRGSGALVLLLIPLGIGGGTVAAVLQPPLYRSTAVLFVSTGSSEAVSSLDPGEAIGGPTAIAPRPGVLGDFAENGYAGLAATPFVLDPVIRQLGLHVTAAELARRVHAESPVDAATSVSVDDPSPTRAADIANAIAIRMRAVVALLTPAKSTSRATLVTRAVPAATPVLPDLPLDLAAGAGAGVLVAGAITGFRAARRAARQAPNRPRELAVVPAHGLFEPNADLR